MKKMSTITRYLALIMMPFFIVSCGGSSSSEDSSSDDSTLEVLSSDASLSALAIDDADLEQTFQSTQESYTARVGYLTTSLTLRFVPSNSAVSIKVNDDSVVSGGDSANISLDEGENLVTVTVTAEDGQTTQSYTIIVLRASATEFAQQAYLKASNAEIGDEFGFSVALDGDTMVVGAHYEDSSADGDETDNSVDRAGAVYVFTRVDSIWSQQALLKASNAGGNDNFGHSVALDGDTLVVGAYREASSADGGETDNLASRTGAAYVFTRADSTWTQQAFLKASNAEVIDYFGYSVAVDGDTVVVGAFNEDSSADGGESDNSAGNSGAAYVFTRVDSNWTQQAFLKASNARGGDSFGRSVALDGDTVVVGAYSQDSSAGGGETDTSAPSAGAAYIFTRVDSTWTQQAFLKASNAEISDQFGFKVALDGDTVVVSAPKEDSSVDGGETDNSGDDAGAVYVFTRVDSIWTQQAFLKASNAGKDDDFGYSVALDGDTMVVGARYEDSSADGGESDNSARFAGAAYVFTRVDSTWTQQAFLKASNAESIDYFGYSVAVDGDTVVVGARYEDSSADGGEADNSINAAGSVYVW
jgi:hypothetical protein